MSSGVHEASKPPPSLTPLVDEITEQDVVAKFEDLLAIERVKNEKPGQGLSMAAAIPTFFKPVSPGQGLAHTPSHTPKPCCRP